MRIDDKYAVNSGRLRSIVSQDYARAGTQIIADLLSKNPDAWLTLNADSSQEDNALFMRSRAAGLDVFYHIDKGEEAYLLRIPGAFDKLPEKIEASLQALGALWRQTGVYEASVLYPPGPGKCAVIATKTGMELIGKYRQLLDCFAELPQPCLQKG